MSKQIIPIERVVQSILYLRRQKVMFDVDLAALYGVPTGHLNRAGKRNPSRFPSDFMFRLTAQEVRSLKCQIGISNWGGRRALALPKKPGREIGFHVRETAPRYRTRRRR